MNDRERRERLEQVQTRLRDIGPELALQESPGFSERLNDLQAEVKKARHTAREATDRLVYLRSELAAAQDEVDALNLAAQSRQTQKPGAWLRFWLLLTGVPTMIWATAVVAQHRYLTPAASIAVCLGCSFALGILLRARARPPSSP